MRSMESSISEKRALGVDPCSASLTVGRFFPAESACTRCSQGTTVKNNCSNLINIESNDLRDVSMEIFRPKINLSNPGPMSGPPPGELFHQSQTVSGGTAYTMTSFGYAPMPLGISQRRHEISGNIPRCHTVRRFITFLITFHRLGSNMIETIRYICD